MDAHTFEVLLLVTLGVIVSGLLCWRSADLVTFDQWAAHVLRSWWLRRTIYHRKLPQWLHACGLSVRDEAVPVDVTVTLVGRKKVHRDRAQAGAQVPKLRRVKSGPSWDEVRVELVPGQKPEDFDEAARALASARKVSRVQVRELAPNVVSLDFQRRDLLARPVQCPPVGEVDGAAVDLRRVWAGRTEYGNDW